ncbi:hypothetical protein C8Q69DRAFT_479870 [Paecilomyces variotii]|uniref:Uncharacterized protein n=1 Tax=Byssochlamys spectabilis TaxID=264951 RepID=A0A443HK07_BYSSP|nr:hypothetical protein C8Q69DRAFT_479870 [Paecilomyces variotii]RWQ92114.1 hypothetical protein C8Q69DRAFT_479870 [Paecilomyces variotii]
MVKWILHVQSGPVVAVAVLCLQSVTLRLGTLGCYPICPFPKHGSCIGFYSYRCSTPRCRPLHEQKKNFLFTTQQ